MKIKCLKLLIAVIFCKTAIISGLNASIFEKSTIDPHRDFVSIAYEKYSLQEAVELMIHRQFPLQIIIEEGQRAGHSDAAITTTLYRSGLPREIIVPEVMRSHMRPVNVLKALEEAGVDPGEVILLMSAAPFDINRFLAACSYLLSQGFTRAELMDIMVAAGVEHEVIIAVSSRLNIPQALVVQAFEEYQGVAELDAGEDQDEPTHFGHVYSRYTLPVSSLIEIGVECANVREGTPISPSRP